MRLFRSFLAINIFIFFVTACKKNNSNGGLAALNIINANTNAPSVLVYLTDYPNSFYQNRAPVYYGSALEYGTPAGINPLSIYKKTDTVKPLFRTTLNLNAGGIYSLYLAGTAPQIDTIFTQDNVPFHHDSAVSLRVINLSSDSHPITVNLEGNPSTQVEFPALAYRAVSDFKSYPATSNVSGYYNFEIRDQASGDLLTTFSWYYTLFQSNTLVISGSIDPASSMPINAFQVNNF